MYKFKRTVTTMTGKVYRPGAVVPDTFRALGEMVKAGDIEEIKEIDEFDETDPEAVKRAENARKARERRAAAKAGEE